MPEETTIYQDALLAGLRLDNHCSDLYIKACPEAFALVRKHGVKTATTFVSLVDGEVWIDVPFAYDPFWKNRGKKQ